MASIFDDIVYHGGNGFLTFTLLEKKLPVSGTAFHPTVCVGLQKSLVGSGSKYQTHSWFILHLRICTSLLAGLLEMFLVDIGSMQYILFPKRQSKIIHKRMGL